MFAKRCIDLNKSLIQKTLLITCELHNCMKLHRYIDIDDLTDLVNVEKFKHTKGNK